MDEKRLLAAIVEQFGLLQERMGARFDEQTAAFDARSAEERAVVTGQFELMQQSMDRRFDELARSIEVLTTASGQERPRRGNSG